MLKTFFSITLQLKTALLTSSLGFNNIKFADFLNNKQKVLELIQNTVSEYIKNGRFSFFFGFFIFTGSVKNRIMFFLITKKCFYKSCFSVYSKLFLLLPVNLKGLNNVYDLGGRSNYLQIMD